MAFMMPMMKKDFELYSCQRSTSNSRSSSKSVSLSSSPDSNQSVEVVRQRLEAGHGHKKRGRSLPVSPPTRKPKSQSSECGSSVSGSPPKSASQNSLNRFHCRLLDRIKKNLRRSHTVDCDTADNVRTSTS